MNCSVSNSICVEKISASDYHASIPTSICPSNLIFRWTRTSFCKHLSKSGWNFACKKNREDKSSYPLERKIVIQKEFFQTAHFSQAFCKCKFVWGRTISQIVIHFAEREPVGLPSEQNFSYTGGIASRCASVQVTIQRQRARHGSPRACIGRDQAGLFMQYAVTALHMPPGTRPRAASHENNFRAK